MKVRVMSARQKDALTEAGNIAAGYAASALSKLIDEKIMIGITKCNSIKINELPQALGDGTRFVVGINMLVPTKNLCSVLMFFPYDLALEYIDIFSKAKIGTTKNISYREYVVLTELGTICLCGYLNALSTLLNEQYIPTPPAVACDVISSILEDVVPSVDVIDEMAILIETKFLHKDAKNSGHFLFIPDQECREAILKIFNSTNS